MQPNRLERVWKNLKVDILHRWDKLIPEDLDACDGQYDLLVEVIRKAYYPGRSHLSMEGEVRDWMNEKIAFYERS